MRIRKNAWIALPLGLALLAPVSIGALACDEGPLEETGEELDETAEEAEEGAEDTFDE